MTDGCPETSRRYRARVAYDGTLYAGFQRQAEGTLTIQGELERAIEAVTRQRVTVVGAGRTDSGVHAAGQVIAFNAAWKHTPADLWRAINASLPSTIALQSLDETEADFHPRYDARSRTYAYTLYSAPVRQPLLNKQTWHVPTAEPLDILTMQRAADHLVGVHDFAAFGQPAKGENTTREVMRAEWSALPHAAPGVQMLRFTIEGNAFLYRMVRRIVGALVQVGSGRLSSEEFQAVFRAADGSWANQTAPAHGLCLIEVMYGDKRGDARWSK